MARNISETEIRRRQKLQGKIGRTTSSLGLAGAAIGGAALISGKKPGSLKYIRKVPGLKKATHAGLSEAGLYTGLAAGGIGGVGGFNQASIYSAESRRRKQAVPVKKDFGMEMGYYGDEGTPLTPTEIEAEIEKAWTPSASNFDSEGGRKKRADAYSAGALVTGGAGAAYGGHHGLKAVKHGRKIKSELMAPTVHHPARAYEPEVKGQKFKAAVPERKAEKQSGTRGKPGYKPRVVARAAQDEVPEIPGKPEVKARAARLGATPSKAKMAIQTEKHLKPALKHGGKAAIGAAVLGGSVAAGMHIRRKKSSDWQPYAKSALSAFGVDHNDEFSKANLKPFMGNLAPKGVLEHVGHVGAGGKTTSRMLAGGMPNHGPRNAVLARGQAKVQGQRAAKQLAQGGKSQATESANLGWRSKAVAHRGLSQPAASAPAGMRGPITSRVQTSAMKRRNSAFN